VFRTVQSKEVEMTDTKLADIADGKAFAEFVKDIEDGTGRKVAILRIADRMPISELGGGCGNTDHVHAYGREFYVAFESLHNE
jgi:hypothetical protein